VTIKFNTDEEVGKNHLYDLRVGDTFTFPTSLPETRYMVVLHRRSNELSNSSMHYVCLQTGIIYNMEFERAWAAKVNIKDLIMRDK
jgi:hypothetical protein